MNALGMPIRLEIYRTLLRAGRHPLTISRIQQKLGMPRSTLSHHLHRLIESGVVSSEASVRASCAASTMKPWAHWSIT
jgi:ArsR family transcriptional regulator, arsenate/arsenite/antimonite-responsive transcriptional repressor